MRLLIGGELFDETLDLVQGTFCHVFLLPKDNVYCSTRFPYQEVCPLCVLEAERWRSAAAESGSDAGADAVSGRLQRFVRQVSPRG